MMFTVKKQDYVDFCTKVGANFQQILAVTFISFSIITFLKQFYLYFVISRNCSKDEFFYFNSFPVKSIYQEETLHGSFNPSELFSSSRKTLCEKGTVFFNLDNISFCGIIFSNFDLNLFTWRNWLSPLVFPYFSSIFFADFSNIELPSR